MASAILPSRNDRRSSDFMSKFTDSNVNFTRLQKFPNRNPNPNPNSRDVLRKNQQQLPCSSPPEAAFISYPINSVPAKPGYRYITFRLDSYTRRELKGLKKRLMSDLKRIRILRQFVCSIPMPKNSYHAPQSELPTAPVVSYTGQKRTKPLPPVKDTKKQCGNRVTDVQRKKLMMRECGQILGKLMKHKHGWVFNSPVDAAALRLYDYHIVITNPMDLGTIKSKLVKNEYESPLEFASDVRLTFQNAMLYNGKGSNVFIMAERLLLLFEDMFCLINQKFDASQAIAQIRSPSVPISVETPQTVDDSLGKPMIMTAIKREMTAEEKAELAESFLNLQLGPEGMHQFMAIVKKGVGLEREGDEIELDLAVLDNETLWELHSFIGRTVKAAATTCNVKGVVTGYSSGPLVEEQGRKRDEGEEDVDIGEEMQLTNFPSVEIEKDVVNGSNSSDSSSDSDSSSSDSGSGTSCNEQEVNSTPKEVVP